MFGFNRFESDLFWTYRLILIQIGYFDPLNLFFDHLNQFWIGCQALNSCWNRFFETILKILKKLKKIFESDPISFQ